MNAAVIEPLRRSVDFSLAVPGSKSQANRAILLAGAAEGTSFLRGAPDSDDIRAALSALAGLGVAAARTSEDVIEIAGRGLNFPNRSGDIDIRSSGTVGRFLPGLLAASPGGDWRLVATDQLARRPLSPLLDALRAWGADLRQESSERSFPLRVTGSGLSGGRLEVSAAASSQFASGVILAAPLGQNPATIDVLHLDPDEIYIDMTLDLMRRFGVAAAATRRGDVLRVETPAPQCYRAADFTIAADANSACYFLALPLLAGGVGEVANLPLSPKQPGVAFLSVLERLGGIVETSPTGAGVRTRGQGLPLRGGFSIDMRAMSEMALTLGVLAVFADAPIAMTNLAHIRGHETDRLAALSRLLAEVGVDSELGPDWIRIIPAPVSRIKNVAVDSLGDHRVAMSFALLGLAANGLTITSPGAVAKTFPDFFARLAEARER